MYGPFNTNPYGAGNYPAMQNRLASLEQTYQQQYVRPQMPNTMSALSGRLVTGIEEARASQVALDGTISYFPSPAENKIYAKGIDMQGLPVFLTYELKTPMVANQLPQSEEVLQLATLRSRVEALECKIKEMEKNESNANVSNAE